MLGCVGVPAKNLERLFPLMLYINAPDLFSFKSCNFKASMNPSYVYAAAASNLSAAELCAQHEG
jgi:hypothetical protein